ncbi:MAG: sigma-54 dependent transcriptional regulator [Desulfobulbaceae bacterium]|jgi:DNA-binding NtrC family response regulator|nr:sigma-54 dependent transcriptional regulator [Desulfobulbaceae bacterium]
MKKDINEQGVLVVDDDRDMRNILAKVITRKLGYTVQVAESADLALAIVDTWRPDVVLTDIKMPGMDGLEFQRKLREIDSSISSIIMTGYGTVEFAVQALKDGAYDFFEKPFENDHILPAIMRGMERTKLVRENQQLQQQLADHPRVMGFVGRSQKMRQTMDLLRRLAPSKATVLIRGESGTGKEVAARALHSMSPQHGRKMVTVNCPALPEHILESELFGYRKGAFTGADHDKKGLFVEAEGSTILLDEVADIPVSVQTKLLRVLQEKEIQPLGQTKTIPVDVRVLASTNQDLEEKMNRGEFREDLFYRLNVMTVTMPSLAEISSDIPLLAVHFLEIFAKEYNRPGLEFTPEALQCLLRRTWRGNIRELQNTINRGVLLCQGDRLSRLDLLSDEGGGQVNHSAVESSPFCLDIPFKQAKEKMVNSFTRAYINNVLMASQGNVSAAARQCGMERQALQRLIRRHGIALTVFRGGS